MGLVTKPSIISNWSTGSDPVLSSPFFASATDALGFKTHLVFDIFLYSCARHQKQKGIFFFLYLICKAK